MQSSPIIYLIHHNSRPCLDGARPFLSRYRLLRVFSSDRWKHWAPRFLLLSQQARRVGIAKLCAALLTCHTYIISKQTQNSVCSRLISILTPKADIRKEPGRRWRSRCQIIYDTARNAFQSSPRRDLRLPSGPVLGAI